MSFKVWSQEVTIAGGVLEGENIEHSLEMTLRKKREET